MYSKVLLATDLSKGSMEVVKCAKGLTALGTEEIVLTDCLKTGEAAGMALGYDTETLRARLKEQKDILQKQGFKVANETVVGSAHKGINRLLKEYECDAVMVPSLGHSLMHDITLGSLAADLMNKISKPIFLVKLKVIDGESEGENSCALASACDDFHSSILFATDFSGHSDEAFLHVEKMTKSGAEEVTLLHVQDTTKRTKNQTEEDLKELDKIDSGRLSELKERLLKINDEAKINIELAHGKPAKEILDIACKIKPSLILVGTYGTGYVNDLLFGSVSHNIVRNAPTSVLLVPKAEGKKA